MGSLMEQIDSLKARRSKLQFHMEQAEKERNEIQLELDKLLPEIQKEFGTTDANKLKEISDGLQEKIDVQVAELATMGINV